MLLEHVLQKPRAWLLAHDTDEIEPHLAAQFLSLCAERRQGKPMAQLIGYREFMNYRFIVTPDVLIPRPETELLVEAGLLALAPKSPQIASETPPQTATETRPRTQIMAPAILDLGTGSGAVAISLALLRPDAFVVATDLSVSALSVAQQNAQALGAHIQWWQGSWYEALPPEGRFDLIVSNPPYIAAGDPHLTSGDLRFEPVGALTDGADGLSAIRQIIAGAAMHLKSGGQLWLEHGYDQAEAVQNLLRDHGFSGVRSLQDLAGIARVTGGAL
jgi:release factor glutamine methyltransferase